MVVFVVVALTTGCGVLSSVMHQRSGGSVKNAILHGGGPIEQSPVGCRQTKGGSVELEEEKVRW